MTIVPKKTENKRAGRANNSGPGRILLKILKRRKSASRNWSDRQRALELIRGLGGKLVGPGTEEGDRRSYLTTDHSFNHFAGQLRR